MGRLTTRKKILLGIVFLIIICIVLWKMFWTGTKNVVSEQNVIVVITAESVEDMYGYQFQMNYDETKLEYMGELTSNIGGIQTIFSKPYEGYQLVGATMVGEQEGYSGNKVVICQMTFQAKTDGKLEDMLSITNVNVVGSDLNYTEDISNWNFTYEISSSNLENSQDNA